MADVLHNWCRRGCRCRRSIDAEPRPAHERMSDQAIDRFRSRSRSPVEMGWSLLCGASPAIHRECASLSKSERSGSGRSRSGGVESHEMPSGTPTTRRTARAPEKRQAPARAAPRLEIDPAVPFNPSSPALASKPDLHVISRELAITLQYIRCDPARTFTHPDGRLSARRGRALRRSSPGGSYQDLLAFFREWRSFQKPKLVDGVPDYTPAAMAAQQREALAAFRQRLAAIDPSGWPVRTAGGLPRRARELAGLDFDHRVLKPWANNPAFYVTVFSEESDQPAPRRAVCPGRLRRALVLPVSADSGERREDRRRHPGGPGVFSRRQGQT